MSLKEYTESDLVATDLEEARDGAVQPVPVQKGVKPTEFTLAAILNLVGSVSVLFCSAGFTNAYGVFQEYYAQTLLSQKTASQISWIGSFNLFIMFAAALPVGYLNDVHGPRILVFMGSVIILIALFMTSLCSQYYQLFLAQGLLLGTGVAFVFLPPFAILPRYFVARRSVALGITVSGASLGGVVWPIALRNLFEKVGFGWGVRISAFIMLPFLATSCLTIRLPKTTSDRQKPKLDLSFIKDSPFIILGTAGFFSYLGLFTPIFYVTSYSISRGLDPSMAFYMVAIINGVSLFGRIIPGIWADYIGPFNLIILSAGISGLVCMCWTKTTSIPGIALWSAVYGFSSGAIISVLGSCAAALLNPDQYGLGIGLLLTTWSIAVLIGEPISGQLLGRYSYLGLSLFAGLALIFGMVILFTARLKINSKLIARV